MGKGEETKLMFHLLDKNMERILHKAEHAEKILQLTADTLLLIDKDGICVDMDAHSNLWFLQENKLLGKNLFDLLPEHTLHKILPEFQTVLDKKESRSKNYRLPLKDHTYYFKCIMHPYEGMVLCQYRDITERSHVKLQLERTNYELKEIQKAAEIGHWKYSPKTRTFFYQGYTHILCSEYENAIQLEDYLKFILAEDRQAVCEWASRIEKEFCPETIEYRLHLGDTIHYIRLQCYLWEMQPDGEPIIEGYIQNITDIQQHRNDINTLTHAINNAKESIFAARKDGSLIFANRQFKKNHLIPEKADLRKVKIYEVVADMQTSDDWKRRCALVDNGNCSDFVAYYPVKHDKNTLAFEGTIYSITTDEGEETFWSFTHDISERIRYESQIKQLNRIMDTTMEHLPAGIVVKDIRNDFRYIYRNRESYNRETLRRENTTGINDFDFYPLEMAEQKRKEDMEIAATGKGMHWIMEGKDKNGNLLILDKQKIMVESEDFSPIIVSIEWDITQMELMKRELLASKEKAETSDKLKSAFLANMSHEIRTPLNAIVGFSRLIAESDDAAEREEYYNIVEANNERLLQLINEILDLSKIESGIVEFVMGPVKLYALCKEIYDAHVFRCPPGVELIFEPSDEQFILNSDKNRLFQVLSNLIGNAFKFTAEGYIKYGYELEDNRVVFHVTDTGLGIGAEKIDKVFERFAKLNDFAQGTGLGLSICKTIIKRLGGDISVSSEVGKGTTFTFTLPYNASEIVSAPSLPGETIISNETDTVQTPETSPGNRDITILVAEDTDSNFDLLNAILGKTYHLVRARDGIEAVRLYEEVNPGLILMDIKMPNLSGLEATQIIRELSADIPIIAQSAYAYEQDRLAAKEAGCNDFLAKPISQTKLKEMIKKWLK